MTTPYLQQWQYVELTVADKSTTSTQTLYLSNRPIIDDSNVGRYVPILKQLGSFGVNMGVYLPEPINSTVVLDDSPGSFGYERRLSDLFERLTPINQTIKLYVAETELTDLNVSADFVLAWTAKVVSYSCTRGSNPTCQLKIQSVAVKPRNFGYTIQSGVSGTTLRPEVYGTTLPVPIGQSVQCKGIRVTADDAADQLWHYGSVFGTQFPLVGVQEYYAKDKSGVYQKVLNAASAGTVVWDNDNAASGQVRGFACWSGFDVDTKNYAFTGCALKINGLNDVAATAVGSIRVELWEGSENSSSNPPSKKVAEGEVDATLYQADLRGASDFWVTFGFSEPYVATTQNGLYIYFEHSEGAGATYPFEACYDLDNASELDWSKAGEGWANLTSSVDARYLFRFYGVSFQDLPSDTLITPEGFGRSVVEVSNYIFAGRCDISKLDLIFVVDGVADDVSGTITGTPNALIEQPSDVIKLLNLEYNGSSWTGGTIDFTRHTDTHAVADNSSHRFGRLVSGLITGGEELQSVWTTLCHDLALRLPLFNGSSSQRALYAWGATQTASTTISDEDCIITKITQLGAETIINTIKCFYAKILIGVTVERLQVENAPSGYSGLVQLYSGSDFLGTALAATSKTLYGEGKLATENFRFLGDSTYATRMAEYFLRVYEHPHIMVDLEVPFFKFRTLDTLDVINIVHPDLPAYFGTSTNAHLPTYLGTEVDVYLGDYPKRANLYRAQIEAKEIVFDSEQVPTLRLTARLLINANDPT